MKPNLFKKLIKEPNFWISIVLILASVVIQVWSWVPFAAGMLMVSAFDDSMEN